MAAHAISLLSQRKWKLLLVPSLAQQQPARLPQTMKMRWQVAAGRFWIKRKGRDGLLKTEASCFLLSRSAWRCRLLPLFLPGLPPHPLRFKVLSLSLSLRSHLISRPASCHYIIIYIYYILYGAAHGTHAANHLPLSFPAGRDRTHARRWVIHT